jgi:hypothetical protein
MSGFAFRTSADGLAQAHGCKNKLKTAKNIKNSHRRCID